MIPKCASIIGPWPHWTSLSSGLWVNSIEGSQGKQSQPDQAICHLQLEELYEAFTNIEGLTESVGQIV